MSAVNLSAAVASLKPGLSTSPEIALSSWTVIKEVSDTLYPLIKTNHRLAAITTGLLATSLLATLIRARLPTIQTQQHNPAANRSLVADTMKVAASAFGIIGVTFMSVASELLFRLNRQYFQRLSEAVNLLQPGTTTPYDTALVKWDFIKHFAEKMPEGKAQIQSNVMWIGITALLALIATVRVIRSQRQAEPPEEYSLTKRRLDLTAIGSLALATVVSLSAYVYARSYYPKLA
jgi:hypothetical protein